MLGLVPLVEPRAVRAPLVLVPVLWPREREALVALRLALWRAYLPRSAVMF